MCRDSKEMKKHSAPRLKVWKALTFAFAAFAFAVVGFSARIPAYAQDLASDLEATDDLGLPGGEPDPQTPSMPSASKLEPSPSLSVLTGSPDASVPSDDEGDDSQSELLEGEEPDSEDSPLAEHEGMPPQPEASTEKANTSGLPGLEVAQPPLAATSAPDHGDGPMVTGAKPEDSYQRLLDHKGKAEAPTEASMKEKIAEDDRSPFRPEKIRSLFFTYWQHEAIVDAKRSRGRARPPTESELKALDKEKPKAGERDLTLDGIVFVATDNWTIWLNGMRVTPSAIPREVIDLRVFKDYIEVKWLDEYTNQVFPIRLRAHQRFNLDMRIFLPG